LDLEDREHTVSSPAPLSYRSWLSIQSEPTLDPWVVRLSQRLSSFSIHKYLLGITATSNQILLSSRQSDQLHIQKTSLISSSRIAVTDKLEDLPFHTQYQSKLLRYHPSPVLHIPPSSVLHIPFQSRKLIISQFLVLHLRVSNPIPTTLSNQTRQGVKYPKTTATKAEIAGARNYGNGSCPLVNEINQVSA
jgi:hypothetical protein